MDKVEKLGMIFSQLADELNISDTLYDTAVTAYSALGKYIKENNKDWDVEVYPQGSFELGTVVKPINEDDQYDVDLVVQVNKPNFDYPQELRKTIQRFLENHGRYEGRIDEKKPCLRITYSNSSQFHMDIACAKFAKYENDNIIQIAKKDDSGDYCYEYSNPVGYIEWFKKAMAYERLLQEARTIRDGKFAKTDVETLSLPKMKTPLQKAIQILKRHRDIFFQKDLDSRPSSIIITTLCALTYDNSKIYQSVNNNVFLTIKQMLDNFKIYISPNFTWEYNLSNPSYRPENFLKKWNENTEEKKNFDKWISKAKLDIITNPEQFIEEEPIKMRDSLYESFSQKSAESALKKYGVEIGLLSSTGAMNIDKKTMSTTFASSENIIKPKPNTFFGD